MKRNILIFALLVASASTAWAGDVITTGNCKASLQGDSLLITRSYQASRVGRRVQVIVSSTLQAGGYTFAGETRYFQGKNFKSKYKRFFKNSPVESCEAGTYESRFALSQSLLEGVTTARLITKVEEESCCRVNIHYDTCTVQLPRKVVKMEAAPAQLLLSVAEKLQPMHRLLHPMSEYKPFVDTMPINRDSSALLVYFPVDKSELNYNFKQNRETLDTITKIVTDIYNDDRSDVQVIQIVGFASIEGNERHNRELAAHRAQVLKDFINARVHQPDSIYEVANGGEAWIQMRDAIVALDKPWKEQLLHIIDSEPNPDKREQKIKAFEGGQPFAHIKKYILENQRNSGYIRIFFNAKTDKAGLAVNEAVEQLNGGSTDYAGLYNLLKPYDSDVRTSNVLGVICFKMGQKKEAVEYFSRGAAAGDTQAARNLQNINNQ